MLLARTWSIFKALSSSALRLAVKGFAGIFQYEDVSRETNPNAKGLAEIVQQEDVSWETNPNQTSTKLPSLCQVSCTGSRPHPSEGVHP